MTEHQPKTQTRMDRMEQHLSRFEAKDAIIRKKKVSIPVDFYYRLLAFADLDFKNRYGGDTRMREMPSAFTLEQAVLGGILLDRDAFHRTRVVPHINEEDFFYDKKNALIWEAISQLGNARHPIDLITVTEQLRRNGSLEDIGGTYYVVELTNLVASSANQEYYSMILSQYYMQRKLLLELKKTEMAIYNGEDVFDSLGNLDDTIKKILPKPAGFGRFDEAVHKGALKGVPIELFAGVAVGNTTYFVGDSGVGKTVFLLYICIKLSKGEDICPQYLPNRVGPRRVVYVNFELREEQLADIYLDEQKQLPTELNTPNFTHIEIRPGQFHEDVDFEKKCDEIMTRAIRDMKADVLVIDNLTALMSRGANDPTEAKKFTSRIDRIRCEFKNLTIIIVSHPVKNRDKSLLSNPDSMAGAGVLRNLADSFLWFARSEQDKGLYYLKTMKTRKFQLGNVYDENNVLLLERDPSCPLRGLRAVGTDLEINHLLNTKSKKGAISDALMEELLEKKSNGDSWASLAKYLNTDHSIYITTQGLEQKSNKYMSEHADLTNFINVNKTVVRKNKPANDAIVVPPNNRDLEKHRLEDGIPF